MTTDVAGGDDDIKVARHRQIKFPRELEMRVGKDPEAHSSTMANASTDDETVPVDCSKRKGLTVMIETDRL